MGDFIFFYYLTLIIIFHIIQLETKGDSFITTFLLIFFHSVAMLLGALGSRTIANNTFIFLYITSIIISHTFHSQLQQNFGRNIGLVLGTLLNIIFLTGLQLL